MIHFNLNKLNTYLSLRFFLKFSRQFIVFGVAMGSLNSCGKIYNSSSYDKERYGANVTGSLNFLAARAVLVGQCFLCHSNWATLDESGFVSGQLVVARDLSGSKLYTRIRGNEITSAGNMPPTGVLTSRDIESISNWIGGM